MKGYYRFRKETEQEEQLSFILIIKCIKEHKIESKMTLLMLQDCLQYEIR